MEAAGFAVALDQRNNRHLAAGAAADTLALPSVFVGFFAANVGLVEPQQPCSYRLGERAREACCKYPRENTRIATRDTQTS